MHTTISTLQDKRVDFFVLHVDSFSFLSKSHVTAAHFKWKPTKQSRTQILGCLSPSCLTLASFQLKSMWYVAELIFTH